MVGTLCHLHYIIHGTTDILHAMVPIGQLYEEAAEARNEHYRLYRQTFQDNFLDRVVITMF